MKLFRLGTARGLLNERSLEPDSIASTGETPAKAFRAAVTVGQITDHLSLSFIFSNSMIH